MSSLLPASTRSSAFLRRVRSVAVSGLALGVATIGLGVASSAPAAAATTTTYYVDAATGNDADSGLSPAKAWKSVAKINATTFKPGTIVRFQRGQTWSGGLRITESGSVAAPIQVRAYGEGARPVIDGGSSCFDLSGSYLTVAYVHARNCDWAGFDIGGDHVVVDHVSASGSVAGVFVRRGSNDAKVTYSNIYDNTKMSVLTKSPAYDDSGAFGVALNGTRTEVAYNTISGHETFSYDFGTDGSAVEIYESSFNSIHHNLIKQSSGFELGGSSSQGNMIAFNQLYSTKETSEAFVTRGGGDQFGPVRGTMFANNSLYLSGAKSKGLICYAGCNGAILTARNNIIVSPNALVYADGAMVEDHNVYWGGGSIQLRSGLGVGSKIADPRYVDAKKADLHIHSTGAAYRKGVSLSLPSGVPVTKDLTGAVPSIGVFQP